MVAGDLTHRVAIGIEEGLSLRISGFGGEVAGIRACFCDLAAHHGKEGGHRRTVAIKGHLADRISLRIEEGLALKTGAIDRFCAEDPGVGPALRHLAVYARKKNRGIRPVLISYHLAEEVTARIHKGMCAKPGAVGRFRRQNIVIGASFRNFTGRIRGIKGGAVASVRISRYRTGRGAGRGIIESLGNHPRPVGWLLCSFTAITPALGDLSIRVDSEKGCFL